MTILNSASLYILLARLGMRDGTVQIDPRKPDVPRCPHGVAKSMACPYCERKRR